MQQEGGTFVLCNPLVTAPPCSKPAGCVQAMRAQARPPLPSTSKLLSLSLTSTWKACCLPWQKTTAQVHCPMELLHLMQHCRAAMTTIQRHNGPLPTLHLSTQLHIGPLIVLLSMLSQHHLGPLAMLLLMLSIHHHISLLQC